MDDYVYLDPGNWYIMPRRYASPCADTFFVLPTCCDVSAAYCDLIIVVNCKSEQRLKIHGK